MLVTFIVAAIVLVGAMAALNLLLTLALIQRLREHAERLSQLAAGSGLTAETILRVGERPGEFTAITADGRELTTGSLSGLALVGFFAQHCPPCKEWVPRFVQAAEAMPDGPARALAVVVSLEEGTPELAAELGEAATVVVEDVGGPVSRAFAVRGYPAMCRLSADGTVASTDKDEIVALPQAAG